MLALGEPELFHMCLKAKTLFIDQLKRVARVTIITSVQAAKEAFQRGSASASGNGIGDSTNNMPAAIFAADAALCMKGNMYKLDPSSHPQSNTYVPQAAP